ncbi:MAG: hypothetical protein DRI61_17410, partial [Chloroflexi bacterium]
MANKTINDFSEIGTGANDDWVLIWDSSEGVTNKIAKSDLTGSAGMNALVDDTSPQLGGDLDLNNYSVTREETAGESLVNGDLCYLKSDGKYWKA